MIKKAVKCGANARNSAGVSIPRRRIQQTESQLSKENTKMLKNMKISRRMILSYMVVAALLAIPIFVSLGMLSKVATPCKSSTPPPT